MTRPIGASTPSSSRSSTPTPGPEGSEDEEEEQKREEEEEREEPEPSVPAIRSVDYHCSGAIAFTRRRGSQCAVVEPGAISQIDATSHKDYRQHDGEHSRCPIH